MSSEVPATVEAENESEVGEVVIKARWGIPHCLDYMAFVGRDTIAIANDVYIIFINLKTFAESVYLANHADSGDGVDCVTGHRSNVFAFAEKVSPPRIFVCSYPTFGQITQLKDPDVNRYKSLCMAEGDLIVGFSGFPNYTISVWSWRVCQRLMSLPTGVVRREQIYMSSRTHSQVCESWGDGLIVWEIAQCYRLCMMQKKIKHENPTGEVEPKIHDVFWSAEGYLYAIDSHANLYAINYDGIGMVSKLEWSQNLTGGHIPHVCAFGLGVIIYCPDGKLRYLKPLDGQWHTVWVNTPTCEVIRLMSNASFDVAALWTERGHVYRVTGDADDKLDLCLVTYKQRNILKMQLIAPECKYLATINDEAELCLYDVLTAELVKIARIEAAHAQIQSSPVDPIVALCGETHNNYGIKLLKCPQLKKTSHFCLTNQIVSQMFFSPTGRELVAGAMAAGHVFIMKISESYQIQMVRYAELGRGLADCVLTQVGPTMRCFSLVLFSDKYKIGEKIVCINAETGKDNKFAGKMQGPYARLLPLQIPDTLIAVPHMSKQFHLLKLAGEKGLTVQVKIDKIIDSGHEIKRYEGLCNSAGLWTFGMDGLIILRQPQGQKEIDLKLTASHRYGQGVKYSALDLNRKCVVTLGRSNMPLVVQYLDDRLPEIQNDVQHEPMDEAFVMDVVPITITTPGDKNWLEVQEDKRVKEEAMDYHTKREEVVKTFLEIQKQLVVLLEENLMEQPLHQLPVSEFNLHLEAKRERLKQAADEREVIRVQTEATIVAQNKVAEWIKGYCWDTMLTPRVKLFAMFSHYVVENYAVLPTQRDSWPELLQVEHLRAIEMENDENIFRPWQEEIVIDNMAGSLMQPSIRDIDPSVKSMISHMGSGDMLSSEESHEAVSYVLSGTLAHNYITIPSFGISQMMAFSFLQMHWLQEVTKLKSQNMRLWFNKEFDDLMNVKKREVGLVEERNRRLRIIISELNKLSDLRRSFHHLTNVIYDPEWKQEEQPWKLITVEPEEVSIEPYISPSQVVLPPPEPVPKDDFKERALVEMMDGVLEKLWHEEIKKEIPKPGCMLDKEPENFNEEDLRAVFEYEAKVEFRNTERDKYRKMLHAEFAKLATVVNEGIVKFNAKVKDMFITKLKVESVIGQENLNLMRMRRFNLDRTEGAEKMEYMRSTVLRYEFEIDFLQKELKLIQEQAAECQSAYEALAQKDRLMDKNFKTNFADLSPIVVDLCYRFFKKRPKWFQRASMIPVVLHEMASSCVTGQKSVFLHPDCFEYLRGVDLLDSVNNMPPVMDEGLWVSMCKMRRAKIDLEIRMRAMCLESAAVDGGVMVWSKAISARKLALGKTNHLMVQHREDTEFKAKNKTMQLVLSGGLVEIITTGHVEDFHDASLIRREDVETINNVIKRIGAQKLAMMRKHMEFQRGILAKEWEHAQMKMKLRHMGQELFSYERLKIPKELQYFLRNKELGYTEEQEYATMEKDAEAGKLAINKQLYEQIQKTEEVEVKISTINARINILEENINKLKLKLSEKRLYTDPMEPIRRSQALKKRMTTLVSRSRLVRELQANHTVVVLLQTQLELMRLKTFPTLSTFHTVP